MTTTPSVARLATCLTLALLAHGAQAQSPWSAVLGVTALTPSVSSGNLTAPSLPGTKADVNANTQVTGSISYGFDERLALNIPLALGFSHELTGAGAIAGVGVLATTKALPITVLGQYHFMTASDRVRPYLGAGLTYALFYDTKGTAALTALTNPGGAATTMSLASKLVPTVQLGVQVRLNERMFLDAHYTKTSLSTRGTLSTGQTLDMTLDPSTVSLGLGWRF
ncbi:MAG: OmpW family protein [Rhodoferax sp.]|nr:OmpW family protein [Rhodoferax sp.]